MTIKKAIESAIERGWQSVFGEVKWETYGEGMGTIRIPQDSFLLDPKFWAALGKTMGWEKNFIFEFKNLYDSNERYGGGILEWEYRMYRMIDALAEGRSIEDYFESL